MINWSMADFARALGNMAPRGRTWHGADDGSTQASLWAALSATFQRQAARAFALLVDAFPATTVELLPEWEKTLGLPDPCAGQLPTIAARQAQVLARFAAEGGQARAYYIAFAGKLGYTIQIEDFYPFRAGQGRVGTPLTGVDWLFAWAIIAPLYEVNYFRAGVAAAGEPLAWWTNTVLECEMNAIKPAHTVLLFEYR